MTVYKVLTAAQWSAMRAAERFDGSPDDARDGFIHLSARDQVRGTRDRHFAGQDGLTILAIDAAALGDALRWEESRGGALFPHLYAALPLSAVTRASAAAAWTTE